MRRKLIIAIGILMLYGNLAAQQGLSLRPQAASGGPLFTPAAAIAGGAAPGVDFHNLTNWGLVGVGNLNLETLKDVNASAKISGYKRLYKRANDFATVYFSLNKNASNNDSLLAGTFLFPDVGNASAAFTVENLYKVGSVVNDNINVLGYFFDFAYKNIKAERDKIDREFSTLNYAFGIKYLNWNHTDNVDFIFSLSLYKSFVNVPDEDNDDYRILFNAPDLKSSIGSWGIKTGIQINNLQFFADFKTTRKDEEGIPVRALRGFNANVGFILNAEIFEQ